MAASDIQSRVSYWATQYGVPPAIALAVAQQESGFNQSARGRAGEVGVMQLMPATAAGLQVNPYDLDQNISGGVQLLADNYNRFGDWSLALSAYNGGPSRVASTGAVIPSTSGYVASVLARAGAFLEAFPEVFPTAFPGAGSPTPSDDGQWPTGDAVDWTSTGPLLAIGGVLALLALA